MLKGIYIATSGAVLMQTQMDTISQNLANANTSGYKKDALSFKEYLLQLEAGAAPDGRAMTDLSGSKTDLSSGSIIKTGNPLDVAVEGKGYIALEGDRFTRRGDLKKDSDGYLTTYDDIKVMGSGGPISLPEDAVGISIDSEGKITVEQPGSTTPVEIDTIKMVDAAPEATVTKTGNGLFTITGGEMPTTSTIKQGFLELSNVNTVKEMVRMIESMREFESYQKAIQIFDNATAKVTNQLGSL